MIMVILVFMSSWGTNTKVVLATDAMTASWDTHGRAWEVIHSLWGSPSLCISAYGYGLMVDYGRPHRKLMKSIHPYIKYYL